MAWIFSLISGTKDIEPTYHTDLKLRTPFGNYIDKTWLVLFFILLESWNVWNSMWDSFLNMKFTFQVSESPQNHPKCLESAKASVLQKCSKRKLRSFWIKLLRIGHCATTLTAVNVPCYYLWSTCHQWTFFSTTFYLRKASKYLVFESSPTFLYHNITSHLYIVTFLKCIDENSRIL